MGLDGLSVNNLMLNKANTSRENAIQAEALANSRGSFDKTIEQVQKKQEVDTGDKDNPSFSGGFTDDAEEEENPETEEETTDDLLDEYEDKEGYIYTSDKLTDREDEHTPTVFEIQDSMKKINPEELAKFINGLKQVNGVFVNKKI